MVNGFFLIAVLNNDLLFLNFLPHICDDDKSSRNPSGRREVSHRHIVNDQIPK